VKVGQETGTGCKRSKVKIASPEVK